MAVAAMVEAAEAGERGGVTAAVLEGAGGVEAAEGAGACSGASEVAGPGWQTGADHTTEASMGVP